MFETPPYQTGSQASASLSNPAPPSHFVRNAQFVRVAIIAGACIIGIILVTLRWGGEARPQAMLLTAMGLGIWAMTVVMSFVMPPILRRTAMPNPDQPLTDAASLDSVLRSDADLDPPAMKVALAWLTSTVIFAAILEGGVVVNLVLWFIGAHWICVVAAIFSITLLAARFPSAAELKDWLMMSGNS